MKIISTLKSMKQSAQKAVSSKVANLSVFVLTLFASSIASAATAPAASASATLGYQLYDLVFVKIYGSGGGYAAGVLMLFWAFSRVKADWKEAMYIGIGASGILALPAIATALGAQVI